MIAVDEPWMNRQTMGATRGLRTLKLSMVFPWFASGQSLTPFHPPGKIAKCNAESKF
jgi:hypothetical protein